MHFAALFASLCAIPFIQLLSITARKVHYLMSRDDLLPTAVGKMRVQGLVCTRTQYHLGIVGSKTACSSIAVLLGTTLTCGTLALTECSVLYATCVATTAHAIFGADNNANGATFSEAAEGLQLSNHLEVASLASLFFLDHTTILHHALDLLLLCVPASPCVSCVPQVGAVVLLPWKDIVTSLKEYIHQDYGHLHFLGLLYGYYLVYYSAEHQNSLGTVPSNRGTKHR